MESKRIPGYLAALLIFLIGLLLFLMYQAHQLNPKVDGNEGKKKYKPDLINGSSIYLKGEDLSKEMIPFTGGPGWFVNEGGGCAVCHGDTGRGGKPIHDMKLVPPNIHRSINGVFGGMSFEEFVKLVKWGERSGGKSLSYEMPRYDLSKKAAVDLYNFLKK